MFKNSAGFTYAAAMLDTDVGCGPYLTSFLYYFALFSNAPQTVWGPLNLGGPVQPNSPGVNPREYKGIYTQKIAYQQCT